ncbi:MAG TPA: hypothetical protein VIT85_05070 [Solirubrobacterales bacterium]
MRDFLLNEAVKRLAADTAVRLSAMVAGGEQIPFDVAENDGTDSLFYRYEPLTSRFVLEREDELRKLPSFAPARDAADAAGVAASYLEACGDTVPADPRERSSKMLIVFLARLWEGSTEFSLDRERLDAALALLDAESRDADEAEILIAPVVGLKMAAPSLQLPHGVRLIRADAIESPVDAMRSDGMGRSAWEPQFLAVAEQDDEPDSAEAALGQLRELISVMRLFKAGGVGLGPHAFAPTGDGHWRRIATGAAAARPGGYRLGNEDCERLVELATTLEARPDPDGALSWAVARFEMGCGRESAMEGLSDHLLSLRAVLEGHGPVGASLPMRASALIADETIDRIEARGNVENALELERSLMNGTPIHGGLEIAAWVEEGARRLLREAALGELGTDLNTAADESLIASGLEGGDIEIAIAPEVSVDPSDTFEVSTPEFTLPEDEETHMEQDTRIMEPVPAEDEIRITATNWLDEVELEESTLDFPAVEHDIASRERVDTPRVRHLFQVPDDADWQVRELDYDRNDRRAG